MTAVLPLKKDVQTTWTSIQMCIAHFSVGKDVRKSFRKNISFCHNNNNSWMITLEEMR